jgi:hypothetical protein
MPLVNLTANYFAPLFNASLLYQKMGEDFDPQDNERTNIFVSLEDLENLDMTYEGDLYSVADNVHGLLLALFGKEYTELPVAQKFISVTYLGDTPKYVKAPTIKKIDDVVGLVIGDDKGNVEDYQFFPLKVFENRLTFEGTIINGLGLDSIELKRNDNTSYRIPLAIIAHPERKTNKLSFQIGISVTPDFDYGNFKSTWDDLTSLNEDERQEAWKDLKLNISSGISASAKIQTIFENMMKEGTFPKRGVIIPITSVIKTGKIEKKDGTGKFFQATFGVSLSDMPGVPVKAYLGMDSDDIPLNTVGSIQCGDRGSLGSIATTNLVKDKPPTPLKPWYLYISAPNAKGNKMPEHQVFTSGLPAKYQRLLEEQKNMEYFVF